MCGESLRACTYDVARGYSLLLKYFLSKHGRQNLFYYTLYWVKRTIDTCLCSYRSQEANKSFTSLKNNAWMLISFPRGVNSVRLANTGAFLNTTRSRVLFGSKDFAIAKSALSLSALLNLLSGGLLAPLLSLATIMVQSLPVVLERLLAIMLCNSLK
jgi:hypothetical protein